MPKSITITKIDGKPGSVYYPLSLNQTPTPTPGPTQLLIKLSAASLNHRDLFIRQQLYPGISFSVPLLADGVGTVVSSGEKVADGGKWDAKRVILCPGSGWEDSPDGPEGEYEFLGGTKNEGDVGTLQEYCVVDVGQVEEAPAHLSDVEAAALPLTGLTAWRALITKGGERNSGAGGRVLVTGIGGGVALMALRFAVARGAEVWVTSSSEEKVRRAVEEMGAKGGVNYKEEGWEKKLLGMLPEGKGKREFDLIVDGAGGEVVDKGSRLLKVRFFLLYFRNVGMLMSAGRRCDFQLRNDHFPQDAMAYESRAEEHRAQGVYDGFSEGVQGDGSVRKGEGGASCYLEGCAGAG